jgi:cold shock CspA family protein
MIDNDWNLGTVNFFDNDNGFGFVKNVKNAHDHFVHISKVLTQPIIENDRVVFQLIPSRKKHGTFEATNVTLLSQFKSDLNFLILQFSQLNNINYKKAILAILPNHCVIFILEQELALHKVISNDLEYKSFFEKVNSINKLFDAVIPKWNLNKIIEKHIDEITTVDYKVRLWLDNIISNEPDLNLIINYFVIQNTDIQEKLYSKLSNSSKKSFFEGFINRNNLYVSFNNLIGFLRLEKQLEAQKEFIYIYTDIFISTKINSEESTKIYEVLLNFVILLHKEVRELLLWFFYNVSSDYIKLKLWLSELIIKTDYDIYQSNFIFLSTEDQQRYIKKLFYLLSKKTEKISYERILALKNLTFTFAEGKKYNLDFTCNIILSSIESIKSGRFLNEESIFSILTKHIENDTSSLLTLNGFFEKCNGRRIPNEIRETIEGVKLITSLKRMPGPRNVEFCEGVRFKENGKDRTFNHDCWWCRGSSCFAANQIIELPQNYNDLTLANFFSILNIEFDRKEYFDFLGLLNKISVYLKHLNCRSCNHILKPNKEKYFTYYRVSNFVCSNSECENKQVVYLNHCLGSKKTAIKSRCDNLIDSRDTVRCNYSKHNPSNDYEKYGPFICNLCGSCCSQNSLEKKFNELNERKWSIQPGLEWKVRNKVGHLEQGEIFCYKCGTEMINNEQEYKDFVSLLENPDNSFKVLKKGTNNYGFWFMVKAEHDFFVKAEQTGLRVSDTIGDDLKVKFVGNGNINFLICKTCNSKYNKSKVEFIIEKDEQC